MVTPEIESRVRPRETDDLSNSRILAVIDELDDRLTPAKLGRYAAHILSDGIQTLYASRKPEIIKFASETGMFQINPRNKSRLVEMIDYANSYLSIPITYSISKVFDEKKIYTDRRYMEPYVDMSNSWKGDVKTLIENKYSKHLQLNRSANPRTPADINPDSRFQVSVVARPSPRRDDYAADVRQGNEFFLLGKNQILINTTGSLSADGFKLGQFRKDASPIIVRIGSNLSRRGMSLDKEVRSHFDALREHVDSGNHLAYLDSVLKTCSEYVQELKYPDFERNSIQ